MLYSRNRFVKAHVSSLYSDNSTVHYLFTYCHGKAIAMDLKGKLSLYSEKNTKEI